MKAPIIWAMMYTSTFQPIDGLTLARLSAARPRVTAGLM